MKKKYEIFRNWLAQYPYADKVAHFIMGFLVAWIASIFFSDKWVCFGIGMVAGLAKEFYDDYVAKLNGSWFDWFATIAGALVWALLIG